MSNREQVIQKIQQEKIIAIVRGVGPDQCAKVANALYAGGIRLMEITYNQKDPASFQTTADAIQTIGKAYEGRMYVGAERLPHRNWWSLPLRRRVGSSSLRM